jgi:hypothetical protein
VRGYLNLSYTNNRRVISIKRGDKAFNREWEKISAFIFEIIEDITMEFQGKSYNIIDSDGNLVK